MPTQSYRQLTVPGSLLLAGEYAVLCSGGLGLGLALEPRVRVYWCASSTFRVHCTYGNQRLEWFPQGDISHSLLEAIWQTLKIKPPFYALTLDSRLMNRPDGRKAGLGSSAAVAVGATAALMYLTTGQVPLQQDVFQAALTAHRLAQGGLGSGYDVSCSTFGGLGLFTGGTRPTWQSLDVTGAPDIRLVHAPQPVSSSEAIGHWQSWCQGHETTWQVKLNESNAVIESLIRNPAEWMIQWERMSQWNRELGRDIGVWDPSNETFVQETLASESCKALGAGNELYGVLCQADHPQRIEISTGGLQWS